MRKKLIVLPGWGQNATHWNQFVGLMSYQAPDIEVHVINLPGFGAEVLPEAHWGVPEYAEWVKSFIEESEDINLLSGDNVMIIGHSFGGRIASYLASQRPEWLTGLVLFGAPCLRRKGIKLELKIRLYKLLKKILPKQRLESFKSDDLVEASGSLTEQILYNVVEFDQAVALTNIAVPTFIIWGQQDDQVPVSIAREMTTLIPNSGLHVIDGAGHNLHIFNREVIAGSVQVLFKANVAEG